MFYKDTLLQDVWPCFVRPKDDELLSSWLIRLAHAHNVKVHPFCKQVFNTVNIWNRDIDSSVKPEMLEILALKCDTSLERVKETTLSSLQGVYFKDFNPNESTNGILPVGVYHRTRKRYAQQFCPSCLKKDGKIPYFRKNWRLSTSVVCIKCKVELLDCCPQCSEPICFYRQELGHKDSYPTTSLSSCFSCGFDLSTADITHASDELYTCQLQLDNIASEGFLAYHTYPHLYFQVFYQLCMIMNSTQKRSVNLQKIVSCNINIPFKERKGRFANRFDFLRVTERREIILIVTWLLNEWPERFINCCKKASCYKSTLLYSFEDAPYWYWVVVMSNLYVLYTPFKHLDEYKGYNSYNSFVKKMTSKNRHLKR